MTLNILATCELWDTTNT